MEKDNIHAFQSNEDMMDEAYAWVLKFNGDTPVSEQDIQAMREWVGRSAAHKQALKDAEDFWAEAELLSRLAVPLPGRRPGLVSRFVSRLTALAPSPSGGVFVAGPSMALASIVFLVLSVAIVTTVQLSKNTVGNGVYATAVGEQKQLRLEDDSQIHLDTNSQVEIVYQEGIRKIHLLQGKAHFDVAKNPERPFEVYAGAGLVRAVGTAFSVYLAASNIEVVVDEGRVDLERKPTAPATALATPLSAKASAVEPNKAGKVFLSLDKGQSARFNQVHEVLAQLDEKDLAKALAWREGALVFVRAPLGEVVSEVGRYTSTTIEIVDPALGDLVMGGRFRVGELDALLEVLEIGFGVEVVYLNERHVQLRLASS